MALTPLRPTDPERYGPYRLQGRLGAGGMGVVYLAFGEDNHPVALKVLQPALAEDEDYRARFVREVSAAQLVDSPYVAKVVAAETSSAPLWMATEYVEGATLAHAVESNGPVPPDRLRGLASDLAAAVAALHGAGLVHRDLKPANVVLAWSGPKLIDFGIAKHEGSTDLTQTGVTVGSLLWMSPEVLAGLPAARSSDVFAWGLCVAFAGSGRAPFGSGNAHAVAYRISQEQPDLRGLPGGLTELVAATLAKDPAARPTADALCRALGGRGQQATAVALPRSDGGWTGPSAAAGTPGVVGPPPGYPPTYPPTGPTPQKPKRGLVLPLAIMAVLLVAAAIGIAILAAKDNGSKGKAGPTPSVTSTPSTPPPTTPSTSPPTTPPTTTPPTTTPPTTPPPVAANLGQAENSVLAAGYTPSSDASASWDPQAPINVILATLTGSADGYNNWAFFFVGNRYIGHDTKDPSLTIAVTGRRTTDTITLAYTIYAPSDPNCCPTGGTQSVRYQWNGSQLIPLDPIPSNDPTGNHR